MRSRTRSRVSSTSPTTPRAPTPTTTRPTPTDPADSLGGRAPHRHEVLLKLSRQDLEAFRGRTVPDLAGPGTRLLFVGINPGLMRTVSTSATPPPPGRRRR